jgi:hypothetical protein
VYVLVLKNKTKHRLPRGIRHLFSMPLDTKQLRVHDSVEIHTLYHEVDTLRKRAGEQDIETE